MYVILLAGLGAQMNNYYYTVRSLVFDSMPYLKRNWKDGDHFEKRR